MPQLSPSALSASAVSDRVDDLDGETARPGRVPGAALLDVRREDIRFGNLGPGLVWLEVEVHNRGGSASVPAPMQVRVAPFGAFVASEPLEVLTMPSISPGTSTILRAAYRVRPDGGLAPHGGRRPGARWGDASRHRDLAWDRPQAETFGLDRGQDPSRGRDRDTAGEGADLLLSALGRLLARGRRFMSGLQDQAGVVPDASICWAGNFDVHIGSAEAERHIMRAIRLESGKSNLAMFVVGERREDFVFDLQGEATAWDAALLLDGRELSLESPHTLRDRSPVLLRVTPPAGTTEGLLAVGVTRQATGKRALVEFGFGTDTIPPRCFRD